MFDVYLSDGSEFHCFFVRSYSDCGDAFRVACKLHELIADEYLITVYDSSHPDNAPIVLFKRVRQYSDDGSECHFKDIEDCDTYYSQYVDVDLPF